ncbi:MAG TPA: hypothetical protein VIF62_36740 [Labilithrix sp.]
MRHGTLGAALAMLGLVGIACTDLGNLTGGADDAGAPDASSDGGQDAPPPPPPSPVDGGSDAGLSTYIVVIGGIHAGQTYATDVWIARVADDGSLGAWTARPSLLESRERMGAAVVDGLLVVACGDTDGGFLRASPEVSTVPPSTWTVGTTIAQLPNGVYRNGLLGHAGRVHLLGGSDYATTALPTAISAPVSSAGVGSWTASTALPEGVSSAVVLTDGPHAYVLGGDRLVDGGLAASDTGWVGDFDASGAIGSWRSVTPLLYKTSVAAGVATGGFVYVSGGFANKTYDYVSMAPIASDGTLGAWSPAPTALHQRAGFTLVAARGHLYRIGGEDETLNLLTSVEVADIQLGGALSAWRETTALPVATEFHASVTYDAP